MCTEKEQGYFLLIAIRNYSVTFILSSELNEGKVMMTKAKTRFLEMPRCYGMLSYDLGSQM